MLREIVLASAVLLLLAPAAAAEAEPPPGSPEAETEPGYLDILGGTAVSLEGDLEEGIEGATFRWRIVEGEGGQLFNDDRPSAVFLAPNVATGMKRFVIEMTVSYRDAPSSSRQLVIRVLSEDFVEADEGEVEEDPTAWLKERYSRAAEEEQKKQDSAPQVVAPSGGGNTGVSVGVGVGSGGYRGGSIGFRFSLSHPIEQPVDVPPPGQTHAPGEGTWDLPYPVPYQDLGMTFPASVADRYAPSPDEPPADPATRTEEGAGEEGKDEDGSP
jgi:hypothetical protein